MGAESTTMPATNSFFDYWKDGIGDIYDNTLGKAVDGTTDSFIDKAGNLLGGAGGGILGYNLGGLLTGDSTLGKIAGGVLGVWFGGSYGDEIMKDIKSAIDYAKNNTDENEGFMGYIKNFGTALMGNFSVNDGQMYNGDGIIERADGKSATAVAVENAMASGDLKTAQETMAVETAEKKAQLENGKGLEGIVDNVIHGDEIKAEEEANQRFADAVNEKTLSDGIANGDMSAIAEGVAYDTAKNEDEFNNKQIAAQKQADADLRLAVAEREAKLGRYDAVIGSDISDQSVSGAGTDSPDYNPDA